jgi:4-amino-4-deoxy-L-arabinose transferase-like glycosyltransferase
MGETPMPRSDRQLWLIRFAIVAIFFAAVAPTLSWLDFYNAEENVVIASALEMRRSGEWLVPTLQGNPRTIKPPLTVWVTTIGIRNSTMRDVQSRDEAVRDAAMRRLAFETRWPTVLSTGLMLVGVFELARAMCGTGFGVVSACACGSCWFILIRQGGQGIPDLQLALWVTWANASFAWMVLRGKLWTGAIAGGVTLALATMSKGPAVPLLQSVVPLVIFVLWRRIVAPERHVRIGVRPFATSILLMLIVGLWWYVVVYLRVPNIGGTWWAELTRKGANDLPPDNWLSYLRALRLMFPWLIWLIIGIAAGVWTLIQRRYDDRMLALFLALVPLLVMNLFEERKERYIIPLAGPLAILAAWPIWEHIKNAPRWDGWEKVGALIHWTGLAVLAIGLPIMGATKERTITGQAWFPWSFAIAGLVAMVALLLAGLIAYRRHRGALVATTVLVMFVAQMMYILGFSRSGAGSPDIRPFADIIWHQYPDAVIYSSYPADLPGIVYMPGVDLSLYMGRTIPRAEDPSTIAPSNRPTVIIATSRENEPEPAPPSPAWRTLHSLDRRNTERWRLFVLPAAPG